MIGQKISNYEVKSLLGHGGMGSVYMAQHPVLGRRTAIKVLRRELVDNPDLVSRFVNEARAASAIRHPAITEVFDVGTLPDGLPYLMMELLEGETLAQRLEREQRLPVEEAVDIVCQAASGLAAAHGHGIVHRDLKPENLFLVGDRTAGGRPRVKVLDFGIAKLHRNLSVKAVRTHTGSVMGTPQYMSPEQCRGISAEIDHRTDVYALGVMLHEMLAGAPPFASEGYGDLLIMHLTQPPTPLRQIDPSIPADIEAVVLHALEKHRDQRIGSVEELGRVLAAAAAAHPTLRDGDERLLLPVRPPSSSRRSAVRTGNPASQTTFSSSTGQMHAVLPPRYARGSSPWSRPPRPRRAALGIGIGMAVGVTVALIVALRGVWAPVADDPLEPPVAGASAPGTGPVLDPAGPAFPPPAPTGAVHPAPLPGAATATATPAGAAVPAPAGSAPGIPAPPLDPIGLGRDVAAGAAPAAAIAEPAPPRAGAKSPRDRRRTGVSPSASRRASRSVPPEAAGAGKGPGPDPTAAAPPAPVQPPAPLSPAPAPPVKPRVNTEKW